MMGWKQAAGAYLELVSLAEDSSNIGDAVIADLADMQQPTHASAQVNESSIRLDRLDGTLRNVTHLTHTTFQCISAL